MIVQSENKIIIIAGPNGVGKTTFAEEFLPKEANCPVSVNTGIAANGKGMPASSGSETMACLTL